MFIEDEPPLRLAIAEVVCYIPLACGYWVRNFDIPPLYGILGCDL